MSATTHEFVVFGQVVYACFALRTAVALVMLEYRDWFNFANAELPHSATAGVPATAALQLPKHCWFYCCRMRITATAPTLLLLEY